MFTRRNRSPLGLRSTIAPVSEPPDVYSESEFRRLLSQTEVPSLKSPVVIFTDHVTDEKLVFLYDGKIDSQAVYFLLVEELRRLSESKETLREDSIVNAIQLIKRRNMKQFYALISQKLTQTKTTVEELQFVPPAGLVLHKTGESLSAVALRQVLISREYFGQPMKKDGTQAYKLNAFKDNYVSIETKKSVEDKLNSLSKMKADPKGTVVFPWPNKKELSEFSFRVFFEEIKTKRPRAIYCRNIQQARMIRDNAIVLRANEKPAELQALGQTLVKLQKIKSSELFYRRFMKMFFWNQINVSRLSAENENLSDLLRLKYGEPVESLKQLPKVASPQDSNLAGSFAQGQNNSGGPIKIDISPAAVNQINPKASTTLTPVELLPSFKQNLQPTFDIPSADDFAYYNRLHSSEDEMPERPNLFSKQHAEFEDDLQAHGFENNAHLALGTKCVTPQRLGSLVQEQSENASIIRKSFLKDDPSRKARPNFKLGTVLPTERLPLVDENLKWSKFYQDADKSFAGVSQTQSNKKMLEFVAANSLSFLHCDKLMLYNIARHHQSEIDENEIESLVFNLKLKAGGQSDASFTFLTETSQHYLSFATEVSVPITFDSLAKVTFELTEKTSSGLLFAETANLQSEIRDLYLENRFLIEFKVNLNGYDCGAVLSCAAVFIPKNLEVAHLTLNQKLLSANFSRFSDLLKKINSYRSYKDLFFPETYIQGTAAWRSTDVLSNYSGFMDPDDGVAETQENLVLSSQLHKLEFSVEVLLQQMSTYSLGIQYFVDQMVEGIKNEYKNGASVPLDVFNAVAAVLTAEERFLLNDFCFLKTKDRLISTPSDVSSFVFQLSEVLQQVDKLNGFVAANQPLLSHQQYLIQSLGVETYLWFENSSCNNANLKFSPIHVELIAKVIRLNAGRLDNAKLKRVCCTQVLSTFKSPNFDKVSQLEYLNHSLVYFKVVFKSMFPDEFQALHQTRLSFDNFLLESFVCSFANSMDAVPFNVYQDFKAILLAAYLEMKTVPNDWKEQLSELGIELPTLIDIVFAVTVFLSQKEMLLDSPSDRWLTTIRDAFHRQSVKVRQSLLLLLETLSRLSRNGFFVDKFRQVSDTAAKRLRDSLKFAEDIQLLFSRTSLSSNIFKEIAESKLKDVQTTQVKPETPLATFDSRGSASGIINKFELMIQFYNQFESNGLAFKSEKQNRHKQVTESLKLTDKQLSELVQRSFPLGSQNSEILLKKLQNLRVDDSFDFVEIYLVLAFTVFSDPRQITSVVSFLALKLTSAFEAPKEHSSVATTIAHLIFNKVAKLFPFFVLRDDAFNTFAFAHKKSVAIVEARANIGSEVVNVLLLCRKFEANFYRFSKSRGIRFDFEFCTQLKSVLEGSIQGIELDLNQQTVNLYLETSDGDDSKFHHISFKLLLEPELTLRCSSRETLLFELPDSKKLIDQSTFENELSKHPLFYFSDTSDLHYPMNFMDLKFKLEFQQSSQKFFECNFKFDKLDSQVTYSNLFLWDFQSSAEKKPGQQSVDVQLGFQAFFLPVSDLIELLCMAIIERLEPRDKLLFIPLLKSKFSVQTKRGTEVSKATLLRNILELDEALKDRSEFVLVRLTE